MTISTDPAQPVEAARAAQAAERLVTTAAAADFRGPDPYDALFWPHWPGLLRGGRRRRQALIQVHARSPVDVRVYRSEHPRIAKALALFGRAALILGREDVARRALGLLAADHSGGAAWGYPFDVQTRWSFYPAETPNVVVTTFAGLALSEAATTLGEDAWGKRAREGARWVADELWDEEGGFFAYHPGSRAVVHNASLLGARLVWRVLGDRPDVRERVLRAIARTLAAQAPDGSFPYGEGPGLEFVDSFHTGFVLGCLLELADVDERVRPAVERGATYYAKRFFDDRGAARLWPSKPYPQDAHATGTGLTTLVALWRAGIGERTTAARLAEWAASEMVRGGHAIHRRHRWGTTRVHYLRWADAHMAAGLADAARALQRP